MNIDFLNTTEYYKISGVVLDRNGNINKACKASFCDSDGKVIRSTTSNHKGKFEFYFKKTFLAAGDYMIKYYGNGVMTKEEWDYITIEPDSETNPSFDFTPPDNTNGGDIHSLVNI